MEDCLESISRGTWLQLAQPYSGQMSEFVLIVSSHSNIFLCLENFSRHKLHWEAVPASKYRNWKLVSPAFLVPGTWPTFMTRPMRWILNEKLMTQRNRDSDRPNLQQQQPVLGAAPAVQGWWQQSKPRYSRLAVWHVCPPQPGSVYNFLNSVIYPNTLSINKFAV